MKKTEVNKQRLEYVDQLKGLAILLVVVGHVFIFSFRVQGEAYISPWHDVIYSFHMPLFAFLSGLFIKGIDSLQRLRKLAERFLIPMIVIGGTYTLWRGLDLVDFVFHGYKFGYWYFLFLLSAYAIITVYEWISRYFNPRNRVSLHLLLASIFVVGIYGGGKMPVYMYTLLGWNHLTNLMPFVFAGYFLRKYDCFDMVMSSGMAFNVASMLAVALVFLECMGIRQLSVVLSASIVFVIVSLFYRYRYYGNFVKRELAYWGRHSLDIYCIHYFFINMCKLPLVYEYTMHRQCSFVELLAATILSILFCYMSVYVCRLLTQSSWMAYICFGQKK